MVLVAYRLEVGLVVLAPKVKGHDVIDLDRRRHPLGYELEADGAERVGPKPACTARLRLGATVSWGRSKAYVADATASPMG